jgi:prepilin-type N-terminal cleavage/methylation domain-containing protein
VNERQRAADEGGFTLPELILATSIMSVLALVLFQALSMTFTVIRQADERLLDAAGAETFAARFAEDARGAADVQRGVTRCGTDTVLVAFADDEGSAVVYAVDTELVAGREIQRVFRLECDAEDGLVDRRGFGPLLTEAGARRWTVAVEEGGCGDGTARDCLAISFHPAEDTGVLVDRAARPGLVSSEMFEDPDFSLVIAEDPEPLLAVAALDRSVGPVTATLIVSAFATADPVPPGARLEAVRLRVAHRQEGDLDSLTVTIEPGDGDAIVLVAGDCAAPSGPRPDLCLGSDLHTDTVDLTSLLSADDLGRPDLLDDLVVTYTATVAAEAGARATVGVDGVELVLRHRQLVEAYHFVVTLPRSDDAG